MRFLGDLIQTRFRDSLPWIVCGPWQIQDVERLINCEIIITAVPPINFLNVDRLCEDNRIEMKCSILYQCRASSQLKLSVNLVTTLAIRYPRNLAVAGGRSEQMSR